MPNSSGGWRPPPAARPSSFSSVTPGKDKPVPLIRIGRRKRRPPPLHASGTWKIAYADFATAMMAFFLLLWMMVALKPEQKVGLATFFDPQTVTYATTSGAGGVLGGRTITTDGSMMEAYAPKSKADRLNQTRDEESAPGLVLKNRTDSPAQTERSESDQRIMHWLENRWTQLKQPIDEAEKQRISTEVEAAEFRKAATSLQQAIAQTPEHGTLEKNLLIDQTPEGMRIQLVDQEKAPMFALGSTVLSEPAKKILGLMAQAIANLPHKIAITGHTDGNPYRGAGSYNNWDLSIARASMSRQALVEAGLDPSRIASVIGKADTEHLVPDDPLAPANRRISFLMLRLRSSAAAR